MEELLKYFPQLDARQRERFAALLPLYLEWNARINVISRKDTEHFYQHHVLHSLAIARVADFAPGSRILDLGTGGGFPGIPLAILFPRTHFTLVDSIGKKVKVAQDVAQRLGLDNVRTVNARAEELPGGFDFVVSRAVARMDRIVAWTRGKIRRSPDRTDGLAPGILCLKGGELAEELSAFPRARVHEISAFFCEDFFATKRVVYLPIS